MEQSRFLIEGPKSSVFGKFNSGGKTTLEKQISEDNSNFVSELNWPYSVLTHQKAMNHGSSNSCRTVLLKMNKNLSKRYWDNRELSAKLSSCKMTQFFF